MVLLSEAPPVNELGAPTCADPDCPHPPGQAGSELFCCEKCEGRFKGEEWAMGGNRAHTKQCPSRSQESTTPSWEKSSGRGSYVPIHQLVSANPLPMAPMFAPARSSQPCHPYIAGGGRRICRDPNCQIPASTDPASEGFCCEKCMGRFKGEEWAFTVGAGTRAHTKMCASRDKNAQWQSEDTTYIQPQSGFMPTGSVSPAPIAWRPPLPGPPPPVYGPYSGGGRPAASTSSDDQKLKSYSYMIQSLKEQLVTASQEKRALQQEVQRLRTGDGTGDTGRSHKHDELTDDMDNEALEELLEGERQDLVEAAEKLMETQQVKMIKLENAKLEAISADDFDLAKSLKQEIDALQAEIHTNELIASASMME